MRVALCVFALFVFGAGSANAAREEKCAAQYSFDEQLTLEWAALGGDPHAQFAMAKCAAPRIKAPMSAAERIYALKWLTLAACDADGVPGIEVRDRMTRRLKYEGDISFRRFGGISRDENWTALEKKFIEFRRAEVEDLRLRYSEFAGAASVEEKAKAREGLSDELARMGPRGMVRLTQLTQCPYFGADRASVAAAWSAANQVWRSSGAEDFYAKNAEGNWNAEKESKERFAVLSPLEKRAAEFEKARLLRTDPIVLAELEDKAALAKLDDLSFMHAEAGNVSFAGRSVTLAVQYALEALGWMHFINGPDNDYGPSTIDAVRKMQSAQGLDETRWLSPEEIRRTVCDAAIRKGDPVSYFHLALMYSEGWGYPKDLDRAAFAIERAEEIMDAKISDFSKLPEWKQKAYPTFEPRIESAKALIAGERAALPAHIGRAGPVDEKSLCN
jgi:peptidoglycan hydrolase-like protein with peptidoglycan-binding domain